MEKSTSRIGDLKMFLSLLDPKLIFSSEMGFLKISCSQSPTDTGLYSQILYPTDQNKNLLEKLHTCFVSLTAMQVWENNLEKPTL